MKQRFLKNEDFKIFLSALAGTYEVYYIQKDKNGVQHLARFSGEIDNAQLGGVRPSEPLKNFFFKSREKVVDGYANSEAVRDKENKPCCILGVKNCDLSGLNISDYVFTEGDFKDPFYIRNRENNLIIASDCTAAIDSCFCHALGLKHYPEKNYDILFSELSGGYLIEGAAEKGVKFLERHSGILGEATEKQIDERDRIRKHAGITVEENIKKYNIPGYTEFGNIVKVNFESPIWENEAKTCVECGCCNVVCPTCHCFYLVDAEEEGSKEIRYKMWDACMYKRFARVAGGANARPHLWMRLRNRFEKKFDFFPEVSKLYACTGCGRCFTGCPGKIDIRRILKDLVAEKKAKNK